MAMMKVMNVIKQIKRVAVVTDLAPGIYHGTWSGYEIILDARTQVRAHAIDAGDDRLISVADIAIGTAAYDGMPDSYKAELGRWTRDTAAAECARLAAGDLVLETTDGVKGACYVDVIVSADPSIPPSVEVIGPAPFPGME